MVIDNWYFVTSQVAKSGVRECNSVHKVSCMFQVYIQFNTAQLAGGNYHLSGFVRAFWTPFSFDSDISASYIYLELLPLEAIF